MARPDVPHRAGARLSGPGRDPLHLHHRLLRLEPHPADRLTPPAETGAFFGLYALSGTATVWIGSALVLVATRVTGTQQAGFVALAVLMTLGFLGLLFVRGGGREIVTPHDPVAPEMEAATPAWTSPVASTRP